MRYHSKSSRVSCQEVFRDLLGEVRSRSDVLSHKVDDQTNSQTARKPIVGSVPGVSMPADKRPGRTLDRNSGRFFSHQLLLASGSTTKLVASWYHSKTTFLTGVISKRVSQITLNGNRRQRRGSDRVTVQWQFCFVRTFNEAGHG